MSKLAVFKNFLKDVNVGAVVPTSPPAVKRVCDKVDFDRARVIVEYGPGTGVFSEALLKRMSPDAQLILVETNPEFCEILQRIDDPRVSICPDSAENIREILTAHGENEADCVISGIPFTFFDKALRDSILENTRDALSPWGNFIVYQYSTFMKKCLSEYFGEVDMDFIMLNIPPVFIFEVKTEGGAS